ncbi:hypothetical protein G6F21_014520 [Rhizopus arrhizus]|nr:hypothetical protein G6F24_016379 [Rhizopus arrhizus]KAG0772252.1 hypothetical protein G6F21_014520 [Rhizopus arrhizus]KAG1385574.1 hypothetical protein G6F60_014792 [Rhizopus arrhizus]
MSATPCRWAMAGASSLPATRWPMPWWKCSATTHRAAPSVTASPATRGWSPAPSAIGSDHGHRWPPQQ